MIWPHHADRLLARVAEHVGPARPGSSRPRSSSASPRSSGSAAIVSGTSIWRAYATGLPLSSDSSSASSSGVLLDQVGEAVQQPRALGRRRLAPLLPCSNAAAAACTAASTSSGPACATCAIARRWRGRRTRTCARRRRDASRRSGGRAGLRGSGERPRRASRVGAVTVIESSDLSWAITIFSCLPVGEAS